MHELELPPLDDDALAEHLAERIALADGPVVAVGGSPVLARLGFTEADGRWTREPHGADGFLGAWTLDVASCRYEAGEPPRDGLYVLAPTAEGVAFTVDWTDPTGQARHVAFTVAFGDRDGFVLERPAADTLDTRAPAGPVTFARRVLSPDRRRMVITQTGMRADGSPFANVAEYVRSAWAWPAG